MCSKSQQKKTRETLNLGDFLYILASFLLLLNMMVFNRLATSNLLSQGKLNLILATNKTNEQALN